MKQILKKLNEIQATINVIKGQKNTFGNYNYRSCEDILQALQPYCEKLGVVILLTDEIKETINYCYVEATARIIDIDTEEEISVKASAGIQERKGMDLSQTFGASSSYARKYALNGLLRLDDNKDADTDAFAKRVKEAEKEDFSFDMKEAPRQTKQVKKEPVVKDDDLPFSDLKDEANKIAQATNNLFKANEEREIDVLQELRDMIHSKLFQMGKANEQTFNYFASRYKKHSFDELSEMELRNVLSEVDDRLEKTKKEAQ